MSGPVQYPPPYPTQSYEMKAGEPQQAPYYPSYPQQPQGGPYGPPPPQPGQYPQPVPIVVPAAPPATVVVAGKAPESYVGHIVLACYVFWCCGGCIFGGIAFFLALAAQNSAVTNPSSARQYGKASIGVSIAGIVVAVIVIIIVVVINVTVGLNAATYGCTCLYAGKCYNSCPMLSYSDCGQYGYSAVHANSRCYHN